MMRRQIISITNWARAVDIMKPYIFKVSTPSGRGTGFQLSCSEKTGLCAIATANHVINHAHEWSEPIKLQHFASSKSKLLKETDRTIAVQLEKDLAFITFKTNDLPLLQDELPLVPEKEVLRQGIQIGWCGFPAIAPDDLCFFTGFVSCYIEKESSYLIDGVVINGVSGGPAFYAREDDRTVLCGIVSAYIPNRATGESLPGVCVFREIGPFYDQIESFKSLDEAVRQPEKLDDPYIPL